MVGQNICSARTSRALQIVAAVCAISSLQMSGTVEAKSAHSMIKLALSGEKHQTRKPSVSEWFEQYDQIRRDAEMSLGEKLQSRSVVEKGLNPGAKSEKKNGALATHLISKYETAVSAMKKLPVLPETRELQEGYTQYFIKMQQVFVECHKVRKAPATKQSLLSEKKKLEDLDKKNKKLDDELRKHYGIPKHKHS